MASDNNTALVSAADWYRRFPAPVTAFAASGPSPSSLRRYTDTASRFDQPALVEELLCLHLGGPKRLHRWREGRASQHDVGQGSLTIVPSLQASAWLTRGPVDFGVVALGPAIMRRTLVEEFDREPAAVRLTDAVGLRSPEIEALFCALLASAQKPGPSGRLYPESLLVILTVTLLRDHSTLASQGEPAAPRKGGLTQRRLRAVLDFMNVHLAEDIGLDTLTALTGLSRAHFFRAFKQSTGLTPHRYLTRLRLERARTLLESEPMAMADIAAATGLGSESHFSSVFRQRFGLSPRQLRAAR